MQKSLIPDNKSKELYKLYELGKISQKEVKDYRAIRYGFDNNSDFTGKRKLSIMFMIQLGIDYIPKNTETKYIQVRKFYDQYKDTILKCACCGESHEEFLTIDHIHNNGAEHKKRSGQGTAFNIPQRLFRKGFKSKDYQILCYNCNCSLGFKGYCPHCPEIKRETNSSKSIATMKKKRQ